MKQEKLKIYLGCTHDFNMFFLNFEITKQHERQIANRIASWPIIENRKEIEAAENP
jgi:hypothetical protein